MSLTPIVNQETVFTHHKEHILAMVSTPEMATPPSSGLMPLELDSRLLIAGHRSFLEGAPHFRQLISYVMIMNAERKVLVYRRKKGGNEARLHDLFAIGIGGHNDLSDCIYDDSGAIDLYASLAASAKRELQEEIGLTEDMVERVSAIPKYIVSNNTPVDCVHIGVPQVVLLKDGVEIQSGEEDIIDIVDFISLDQLSEYNLESWSKIIVDAANEWKDLV